MHCTYATHAPNKHCTMVIFHRTYTVHAPYKTPYMHHTCTVQACIAISKNILSRQLFFYKINQLTALYIAFKVHVRCKYDAFWRFSTMQIIWSVGRKLSCPWCIIISKLGFVWWYEPLIFVVPFLCSVVLGGTINSKNLLQVGNE